MCICLRLARYLLLLLIMLCFLLKTEITLFEESRLDHIFDDVFGVSSLVVSVRDDISTAIQCDGVPDLKLSLVDLMWQDFCDVCMK